jgi:hypothetical protein
MMRSFHAARNASRRGRRSPYSLKQIGYAERIALVPQVISAVISSEDRQRDKWAQAAFRLSKVIEWSTPVLCRAIMRSLLANALAGDFWNRYRATKVMDGALSANR